jgi:Stress up-regulated Nod 19
MSYDVPKLCPAVKDPSPTCIHTLETIQSLHGPPLTVVDAASNNEEPQGILEKEEWVDVVYMVGHLQRGGIEITASFANNDTEICRSLPTYGHGSGNDVGNHEPEFIVAMSPCTFHPPLRVKITDQIKILSKYNATEAHTGAMGLFYIALADVFVVVDDDEHASKKIETVGFGKRFQSLAVFVGIVVVMRASWKMWNQSGGGGLMMSRRGYEAVPSLVV